MKHIMERIQSKLHRIGTYDVCKTSLSCFDDKRYILDGGINNLADFIQGYKGYIKYINIYIPIYIYKDILNQ